MKVLCSRCMCLVEADGHGLMPCTERMRVRLELIRKATLTGTMAHIRWLLDTVQPGEPLVHALHYGLAVCGFDYPIQPGHWPAGHTWHDDLEKVTCALCKGFPNAVHS